MISSNRASLEIRQFFKSLIRRKTFSTNSVTQSELKRCLNTFDLTFLGIGSTLGLGVYLLAGKIASTLSGPAVVLSFLIAAVASVFSGLCYAEFGARVPRAGSAYVYSYVSVGEFMAFIIGWNLILEYVIGTASVARGYSDYIDSLFDGTMKAHMEKWLPINIAHMSTFPDFLSLGITLSISAMLCFGVSESAKLNNIFTCLNLLIIAYSIICGSFKADIHNWQLTKEEAYGHGDGGFMPFGFSNMMTGAAQAFYGFVGFDCIATTGEEVKDPQRAIPRSIVLSLFVVFLSYSGVSAIQTLMVPYFYQNQQAPLPYVFQKVGWNSARWVISIGALFALSTSLLGAMFPLPRVLYAMANDGLIFRFLAKIHPKYKTPIISTIVAGVFSGVMAMLFNVDDLFEMMSIGTLLAYSLVAVSVLILRYYHGAEALPLHQTPVSHIPETFQGDLDTNRTETVMSGSVQMSSSIMFSTQQYTRREVFRQILNLDKVLLPSQLSTRVSIYLISVTGVLLAILAGLLVSLDDDPTSLIILIPAGFVFAFSAFTITALKRQPQNPKEISFKVPLMPLVPFLSVFVNLYLMMKLKYMTWIRFGVWMAFGFMVYFGYGIRNSSERLKNESVAETENIIEDLPQFTEKSPLVTEKKS